MSANRRIKGLKGAQKGAQTRSADVERYLRAARFFEKHPDTDGCCSALYRTSNVRHGDRLASDMREVFFAPGVNPQQRNAYWMETWDEYPTQEETSNRRILALCFMAELVRTGDA